jgi:hypothetical protein
MATFLGFKALPLRKSKKHQVLQRGTSGQNYTISPDRAQITKGEGWRPRPESNRGARICSPLRHHSATRPTNIKLSGDERLDKYEPRRKFFFLNTGEIPAKGHKTPAHGPDHDRFLVNNLLKGHAWLVRMQSGRRKNLATSRKLLWLFVKQADANVARSEARYLARTGFIAPAPLIRTSPYPLNTKAAPAAISTKPTTWLNVSASFNQNTENPAKTTSVMTS